jgi:hypothetical protein
MKTYASLFNLVRLSLQTVWLKVTRFWCPFYLIGITSIGTVPVLGPDQVYFSFYCIRHFYDILYLNSNGIFISILQSLFPLLCCCIEKRKKYWINQVLSFNWFISFFVILLQQRIILSVYILYMFSHLLLLHSLGQYYWLKLKFNVLITKLNLFFCTFFLDFKMVS